MIAQMDTKVVENRNAAPPGYRVERVSTGWLVIHPDKTDANGNPFSFCHNVPTKRRALTAAWWFYKTDPQAIGREGAEP